MKSNKTKSAMTALVIAAMICTAAMPVKAEESKWVNNDGNWSLIKADGKKATGWVKDGECWYAFDENGSMRTGWVASHEHWYYMGESGVMQVNTLVEDNGAKYFVKGTGVMAKDYVKDGYEFTSDGKAIPLSESKSVVLTDAAELEGKVIEGNLYVDVTTAKEIELKGVTVIGKLIIIGDNETKGKLTLIDSTVETINTQSRNSEVVLSGDTEVKNIVIEETAKVTTDKDYKGKVENFEIQSTTKGTVVIEVPAENVTTNSYATVDVQAPVENLEVRTETEVKVNSDVKNVTVTETAKNTTVDVAKGNKVGTITADAPVKIDGKGTVEKVEANVDGVEAGKDTTIKEVATGKDVTEAPDATKPDKGGSSGGSDNGGSTPTPTETVLEVESDSELRTALTTGQAYDVIKLKNDIAIVNTIEIPAGKVIKLDLNGQELTFALNGEEIKGGAVYCIINFGELTVKDSGNKGVIKTTGLNSRVIRNEGGNFVLESGTIELASKAYTNAAIVTDSGKTEILGGKIKSTAYGISGFTDSEIILNHAEIDSNYPCLSGNGLESSVVFTIKNSTLKSNDVAVYFPSTKTLKIENSTITGKGGALDIRAGETTIIDSRLFATSENAAEMDKGGSTDETGSTVSIKARDGYASLTKTITVTIDDKTTLSKTASKAKHILIRASSALTDDYTINVNMDNIDDIEYELKGKSNLTVNINKMDGYFTTGVKNSVKDAVSSFNSKNLGNAEINGEKINVNLTTVEITSFTGTGVISALSEVLNDENIVFKVNDAEIDKQTVKQGIIEQFTSANVIKENKFVSGSVDVSFGNDGDIITYTINITVPEQEPESEQPMDQSINIEQDGYNVIENPNI